MPGHAARVLYSHGTDVNTPFFRDGPLEKWLGGGGWGGEKNKKKFMQGKMSRKKFMQRRRWRKKIHAEGRSNCDFFRKSEFQKSTILPGTIWITKAIPNLPLNERKAITELKNSSEINVKKADKGTTTVIMSKLDKTQQGQTLLDDGNNYTPLEDPMAGATSKKWNK